MARIFGSATMVAACIGPQDEHSRLLFDKCGELKRVELATHGAQRTLEQWLASPKDSVAICESLQEFGSRTYWSRLWIVQELHVAPDIYFYCGEDRFHWNVMEKIRSLHEKVLFKDQTVVCASTATRWMDLFTILSRLGGIGTRGLLTRLWKLECEDKRDRVYGILHWIEQPPTCEPLVPDYRKSVIDVALEFMDYILTSRTVLRHTRALLRALEIQSWMIPHPTSKSELCALTTCGFERAFKISRDASGRLTVPLLTPTSTRGLPAPNDNRRIQPIWTRDTQIIIAHANADIQDGDILLIETPFALCLRSVQESTSLEWAGTIRIAADWLVDIKVHEPVGFIGVSLVNLTFEIQLTKEEIFMVAADDSECIGQLPGSTLPSVGQRVRVGHTGHTPLMNDRDWSPYVAYFADHPDCQVTGYL